MAQALLGEDGRGFELARRLDGCGAWRAWLGDSAYASFAPSLASPSAWDSFLSSKSPSSLVRLQLRARALLYDKASVALALRHPPSDLSDISTSYLQLHGDDVYFSLEDAGKDSNSKMRSRSSSSPSKSNGSYITKASSAGSRVIEIESTPMQKDKHDDLPDLWYDQFIEKYRINRHLKFPFKDWDSMKRTPEGMSSYLKLATMQKRRRIAFKDDKTMNSVNTVSENGTLSLRQQEMVEDDVFVIPELMYPFNCVPDNAILPLNEVGTSQKVEVSGVLDCLPHLISPSPAMIERFGIRPEYLRVEFGRIKYRGKGGTDANRKNLGQDQASQTAKKVIAQTLVSTGLDGGSGVSIQILSQFLGSHISKLGRILKLLSDSYRRQFTSTELIKMFLKITGYGNLGALSDCLKNNARNVTHQVQQGHSLQGQHEAHQLPTHQQQIQRPMLSQFNALRPQNVFQQQQLQIQQQILQQQQQKMQVQMQQQQQQMSLQKQQLQMQQKLQRQHGMQMQQQQQQQQMQIQMHQQQHMQQHKQQQIQMQQQQIPTQSQQQQIPTQSQQQQLQLQSQQQQIQTQTQQHQMLPHSQQMQSPPQQMQSSPQQIQIQQQQQQQILSQSQQMQSQPQQMQLHQQQVQSPPQQLQMPQQHLQLNIQQQLMQQQIRQRQMPAARNSAMSMEKERAGAEIKGENISEHSTDGTFNPVNRQQLQFRNQQLAGSTNHHAQQSKPFKQFAVQSPQLQTQGNLNVRTPPVKVEGFQELMSGGDAAAEERKLTSPSK